MDDDDEGGGPAQGAPGETLYPFGSWICYFCEQVNGPAPHFILTAWDHRTEVVKVKIDRKLISLPLQADPSLLERERLAVLARDAANVSEFRATESLRTSWYDAQRRDPSLAGSLRGTEPPMRIAGDDSQNRPDRLRSRGS